jgi:glycosyltransferase involved in cell wall biosynthesis
VSKVRRREIIDSYARIADSLGVARRTNEVIVIPNPVSDEFFRLAIPIPESLADLAPRFRACTRREALSQEYDDSERFLFSKEADAVRILVSARIVEHKGIEQAIRTAKAYADVYKQTTILIVTGAVDFRGPNSRLYWKRIWKCIEGTKSSHFRTLLLGGVEWRFMPWIYSQASLLFAPFRSEGFGMSPVEAAVRGLATVMSNDPAMMETTGGNALIIRGWSQMQGVETASINAANQIHRYLSSSMPQKHVANLTKKANDRFSSEAVSHQLIELLSS